MAIRRPLFGMLFLDSVAGFMFGGLSIITVMIAVDQLGVGEAGTGYLNAAVGIGGVLGAIGSGAIVARPNLAPAWFAGVLGLVLGFVLLGFSTALAPALLAMGIIAAGSLVADIVSTTIFQRIVPDELRGRVLGGMQMLQTGTYAAGSLVMPIAFAAFGPQVILPLGALIMFGAALVSLSILRPYFRREPDAATDTPRPGQPPADPHRRPGTGARGRRPAARPRPGQGRRGRHPAGRSRGPVLRHRVRPVRRGPGRRRTGVTRRLRVMGPDEVFGELGLMYETPRTATVTGRDGRPAPGPGRPGLPRARQRGRRPVEPLQRAVSGRGHGRVVGDPVKRRGTRPARSAAGSRGSWRPTRRPRRGGPRRASRGCARRGR